MAKTRRSLRTLYRCWPEAGRHYAEAFLDGDVFFHTLTYFRNIEDGAVRGDGNEGSAVMWMPGGLLGRHNGRAGKFRYDQLRSTAHIDEILVYCLSDRLTDRHLTDFGSVVVEVSDPREFISRVDRALPPNANRHGMPGKQRLDHRVKCVKPTAAMIVRWAIPGKIATTKLVEYEWQAEVRLLFCTTDAFGLEDVRMQLEMRDGSFGPQPIEIADGPVRPPRPSIPTPDQSVPVGNLRDIARILPSDEVEAVARRSRPWFADVTKGR